MFNSQPLTFQDDDELISQDTDCEYGDFTIPSQSQTQTQLDHYLGASQVVIARCATIRTKL